MKNWKRILGSLAALGFCALIVFGADSDPKDITVTITKGQYDVLKRITKWDNAANSTTNTPEQYAARSLAVSLARSSNFLAADEGSKIVKKLSQADTNTVAQVKALLGILD